uniref:Replication initiator protein n=1 Tax=Dulem virus 151 TaxID=3145628 RepID=A0AAU8AUZ5_9VIRU
MACYHPLIGIQDGWNENGKRHFKIVPYNENYLQDPYWKDRCVTIPCGQCIGCRIEYSRQWANRCMLELEYHDSAYFITLTYDNEHIPITYYADSETGEALPAGTLCKRDFQLFMKRLRKAFLDDHIRFFMCGEYGDDTFRPHYHAIIYGLHLNDLVPYKRSPDGKFIYYNSPCLQRCWSVVEKSKDGITPLASPIGFAVVAQVTWETCAYVARYVMKKQKGPMSEVYQTFNIEPPFTLMSRKPGIARQWYEDHPDCYDYEFINIKTETGGKKFRPPRYFDSLLEHDDPDKYEQLKETRRRMAEASQAAKKRETSLSFTEALEVQERSVADRLKKLQRRLDSEKT